METILAIFGLFLIPLSIRYIFNPSRVRPLVGIPAESIFLTGAFLLLKPSIASSLTFESLPHGLRIASIVAFLLAGDALFKALLYIGVNPQSPTLLKVFMIHGKIFVGHLMDLARHVLGLRHILLDCVGHFGRTLCGLEYELENDIDLESQTHANTPPSYDDSPNVRENKG